jgi:hypothetical protein
VLLLLLLPDALRRLCCWRGRRRHLHGGWQRHGQDVCEHPLLELSLVR